MTRPKRILAVGASRGGVADVFARVISELRDRGHRVDVLEVPTGRAPGLSGLLAALKARRRLRAAEVVHLEFGSNDLEVFWFALAAVLMRRNCVVVAHDHPELAHQPAAALMPRDNRLLSAIGFRILSPLLDGALTSLLLTRAGVLAVLGERAATERRAGGVRRVAVIDHGGDPPRDDLTPPSQGECILFAGFIGPGKGVDVLLQAWRELRHLVKLPLVLAGAAEGPNAQWLQALLAELGDGPNPPRVLGAIANDDEFQRLMESAAIVVLPYRGSAPASGILVRAMRAGRAIVATPVPAMEQVLVDGENGLLIEIENPSAISHAILRLARAPGERDRLGAAAAQTGARAFSWERHVDGLERAYEQATPR